MVYTLENLNEFLTFFDKSDTVKKGKTTCYNFPCSFDIETTNTYIQDEKFAFMYIWQFAVNDNVIIGRTWNEFNTFINALCSHLELGVNRLVVYVHNLSFEFQFLRKRFEWVDVFADNERKPIKAVMFPNIEFRCSYRLSGYNLDTVAKNLKSHKYLKLVGNLDYDKIRTHETEMSNEEIAYCINDVLIVNEYIKEKIVEFGNIVNIPLTQTGIVRRYVKNHCLNEQYRKMIMNLTLCEEEYKLLKFGFQGGFTHASSIHANKVIEDVTSYDFTSSYPTVMISEKYPMSKGQKVKIKNVDELDKISSSGFGYIVYVSLDGVKSSFLYENILSLSKCINCNEYRTNNGRIVSCGHCCTVFNNIDFDNFRKFYTFENIEIKCCYVYKMDYLPKSIIECILKFYKDKTELKGVEGKETEYLHGKELLNSMYGMSVTNIIHDEYTIDEKTHEWTTRTNDIKDELDKYNTDKERFLFYPWGVWVTSYARRNLYTAILECGYDYVYSDTDSVKITNPQNHKAYFDSYNVEINAKIERCLKSKNIDVSESRPKTKNGIEKPLGVWDYDGHYDRFKTLGAKRYMIESDKEFHLTVSGWNKKNANTYMSNRENPFDEFSDGLEVPKEESGRLTHTYIDDERCGIVKDFRGHFTRVCEKSSVHLEKSTFAIGLASTYLEYLTDIQYSNIVKRSLRL